MSKSNQKKRVTKIETDFDNELPDFKQNPTEIFRLLDFNLGQSESMKNISLRF